MKTLKAAFSLLLCLTCMSVSAYAEVPSTVRVEALYQEGREELVNRRWDEALKKFELLNTRYADSPYKENVKCAIIICLCNKKDDKAALRMIDDFILEYPQSKWIRELTRLKIEIEDRKSDSLSLSDGISTITVVGCVIGAGAIGILLLPPSILNWVLGFN